MAEDPRAAAVLRLLREQGESDEYGLIKALQALPDSGLPAGSLIEPLTLFRCHFLLYNTLYRLRDRLWRERAGHLEIGPLKTALYPYRSGAAALAASDPLRAFYLDMGRLENTSEVEVTELLGRFWVRLYAGEEKTAALATLGLTEPTDYTAVKRRYRELAMRHHPDRGGDQDTLQKINAAMEQLENYYRP